MPALGITIQTSVAKVCIIFKQVGHSRMKGVTPQRRQMSYHPGADMRCYNAVNTSYSTPRYNIPIILEHTPRHMLERDEHHRTVVSVDFQQLLIVGMCISVWTFWRNGTSPASNQNTEKLAINCSPARCMLEVMISDICRSVSCGQGGSQVTQVGVPAAGPCGFSICLNLITQRCQADDQILTFSQLKNNPNPITHGLF